MRFVASCIAVALVCVALAIAVAAAPVPRAPAAPSSECTAFCPFGAAVASSATGLSTATATFQVPPLPTAAPAANLTSTLFTGAVSQWGNDADDVYVALVTLSFDPAASSGPNSDGAWVVQAVIQAANGTALVAGQRHVTPPNGHSLTATFVLPSTSFGGYLQVAVADPQAGLSTAMLGGFPAGGPTALSWQVGWGWNGVPFDSNGDADCSVLAAGGGPVVGTVTGTTAFGDPYAKWAFQAVSTSAMAPFCALAATATPDPTNADSVTVDIAYTNTTATATATRRAD